MTGRSRSSRAKAEPVEEVVPEPEIDLVQEYQDKTVECINEANNLVKATPSEVSKWLSMAQVFATMANTEALRAWYAAQTEE